MNSWPRHSGPVFCCSRFSIVNEEDRRGRGLLVLICPEGSLGITINSQLLAHRTSLRRHCQFVPIREAGFWVSAVRSRSDPDHTGLHHAWISQAVENSHSFVFFSTPLHVLNFSPVGVKCQVVARLRCIYIPWAILVRLVQPSPAYLCVLVLGPAVLSSAFSVGISEAQGCRHQIWCL